MCYKEKQRVRKHIAMVHTKTGKHYIYTHTNKSAGLSMQLWYWGSFIISLNFIVDKKLLLCLIQIAQFYFLQWNIYLSYDKWQIIVALLNIFDTC